MCLGFFGFGLLVFVFVRDKRQRMLPFDKVLKTSSLKESNVIVLQSPSDFIKTLVDNTVSHYQAIPI